MLHAFSDYYIIPSPFLPRSYVFRFQYCSCSFGIFGQKVSENDRNDNRTVYLLSLMKPQVFNKKESFLRMNES